MTPGAAPGITEARRISAWLSAASELVAAIGCESVIEPVRRAAKRRSIETIDVLVAGGPSAGKTTAINCILSRPSLPASLLSRNLSITVCSASSNQTEGFKDAGSQPSEGLRPFSGIAGYPVARSGPGASLEGYVHNAWMEAQEVRLIKGRPFDQAGDRLDDALNEYLSADSVVLVVNALVPMNHSDRAILRMCAAAGIPVLVVLSRLDVVSAEPDRQELIEYVRSRVAEYSEGVPIFAAPAGLDAPDSSRVMREHVEALLRQDFIALRNRRVAFVLASALEKALAAIRENERADRERLKKAEYKAQVDRQTVLHEDLKWQHIEAELDTRRGELIDKLRERLSSDREAVLDVLVSALVQTRDVKEWWERQAPRIMQREIQKRRKDLSEFLTRQVKADLDWLAGEMSRAFGLRLQVRAKSAQLSMPHLPEAPRVKLEDPRWIDYPVDLLRAGALWAAGYALGQTRMSGLGQSFSILVQRVAADLRRKRTEKQQRVLARELYPLLIEMEAQTAGALGDVVREGYEALTNMIREQQAEWINRELDAVAVQSLPADGPEVNWPSLRDTANRLLVEVRGYLGEQREVGAER